MVRLFACFLLAASPLLHAAEDSAGCSVGDEVFIAHPSGLVLPAEGTDGLSRSIGVGGIRYEGDAQDHRVSCVVSNETGRPLSLGPDAHHASVVRNARNRLYFVSDFFQLSCEIDGASPADLIRIDQIDLINEALKNKVEIFADACVS